MTTRCVLYLAHEKNNGCFAVCLVVWCGVVLYFQIYIKRYIPKNLFARSTRAKQKLIARATQKVHITVRRHGKKCGQLRRKKNLRDPWKKKGRLCSHMYVSAMEPSSPRRRCGVVAAAGSILAAGQHGPQLLGHRAGSSMAWKQRPSSNSTEDREEESGLGRKRSRSRSRSRNRASPGGAGAVPTLPSQVTSLNAKSST